MSRKSFILMFLLITAILTFEQWVLEHNMKVYHQEIVERCFDMTVGNSE